MCRSCGSCSCEVLVHLHGLYLKLPASSEQKKPRRFTVDADGVPGSAEMLSGSSAITGSKESKTLP